MMRPRVVVLGLDAASPELLLRWARDGSLPNLAALMARGRNGPLRGLDGFFIGSTWPSLYTGVDPAGHGFHYQIQLVPGTYRLRHVTDGNVVAAPQFWQRMSAAGKRVAILDVPLAQLDPSVNGIQVVEWGVHDALYGFGASPTGLGQRILAEAGRHPVGSCCDGSRPSAEDQRQFVDRLTHGVEAKARLTRRLLAEEPWDFFMQVFSEAHCVGHQCWHLHDPTHPAHDSSFRRDYGDPVLRVYKALDRAIGEILDDAGDAIAIVFTAHGMGPWYGAQFLLRDLLVKLGVTVPESAPASQPQTRSFLVETAASAWRQLPERVRESMQPLRNLLSTARSANAPPPRLGVDTTSSACFPLSNGMGTGGIRLNVAGREPTGVVRPGRELDSFVDGLTRDLLAIVDAASGRPLIRRVHRTAHLYQGPCATSLPDLVVEWSDTNVVGSSQLAGGAGATVVARSPKFGDVGGTNHYGRTGEHRRDGFLVAAGPGVKSGWLDDGVSLLDLAPGFCELVGVPPARGDGYTGGPLLHALFN